MTTVENILSYIYLRQDISFSERAFNAADALILSALAYVDWSDISQEEETALPLICLKYLSQNVQEVQPKEDPAWCSSDSEIREESPY